MITPSQLRALAALGVSALLSSTPAEPIMGPGVSQQLAAERSSNISGVRYGMQLAVGPTDLARGTIRVRFTHAGDFGPIPYPIEDDDALDELEKP